MYQIKEESEILNISIRKKIIDAIQAQENEHRKARSLKATEIYTGDLKPYIIQRFYDRGYSTSTIREIPIQNGVNICKKTIDCQGNVYGYEPSREFMGLNDNQLETIESIYEDGDFDTKLMNSNRYFKLQNQNHILCEPVNGKLQLRVLKQHQIDAIPDPMNPEKAIVYVISGYDKYQSDKRVHEEGQDNMNSTIADYDDYQAELKRYTFWSNDYHFVVNGKGEMISEETDNPIGIMPIMEVSIDKDFEYFIRNNSPAVDFALDFAEQLSSNCSVVNMQGFAQAYLRAPAELQPQTLTVGVTKVLRLIDDPHTEGSVEFDFAQTGADLSGIQAHLESLLSMFLSSMGLDASTITGTGSSKGYASGIERLLAMINEFEASRSDMAQYRALERKLYAVVVAWLNALSATDQINEEYKITLPENSTMQIEFHTPEMIKSDKEVLETLALKQDLGIIDTKGMVAEYYNISEEEAKEKIDSMESDIDEILKTRVRGRENLSEDQAGQGI